MKQTLVTLDMEGVLTPEIWIAVAESTGVQELRRTTRDEPDYDRLMAYRLEILERHQIGLTQIQEVIARLGPLPGAAEFLGQLRQEVPVVILSDTFSQFAEPLMRALDWPVLFCHRLVVTNDRITGYELRQPDQKRQAVAAFQSLNYQVIAAGDSFNDVSMLAQADHGILFRAPENVAREFPAYPAVEEYGQLQEEIRRRRLAG